MAPLLTTGPVKAAKDSRGRTIRIEPCDSYEEALTVASLARRNGLAVSIATPHTFGVWGIYMEG